MKTINKVMQSSYCPFFRPLPAIIFSVLMSLLSWNVFAVDITNAVLTNQSGNCAAYLEADGSSQSYSANVSDVQNNTDYSMAVTISGNSTSGNSTSCILSANGIPNHNFNATGSFAHAISANQRNFSIPLNPSPASSVTPLSQNRWDAVMLNGVVLDLLSAGCYNPTAQNADANGNTAIGCSVNDGWLLDPLGADYTFGADEHNAHTQPDGTYHYHGDPVALWRNDSTIPTTVVSPVIGFAADGYPIYGPYFFDVATSTIRKAVSSYSQKTGSRPGPDNNNPGGFYDGTYIDDYQYIENSGDLDQCNGMVVNNQYGYYVTDSYPWVLNCFIGTVDNSFSKNMGGGTGPGGPPGGGFPPFDRDGDGVRNHLDNCPDHANPDQNNLDGDHQGDACDYLSTDADNDLIDSSGLAHYAALCLTPPGCVAGQACMSVCYVPPQDNCPNTANPDQHNLDGDNLGDACDYLSTDPDNDLVDSSGLAHYAALCLTPPGCVTGEVCMTVFYEPPQDNCPYTANSDQEDADGNGQGDACDVDIDGDGRLNDEDAFPEVSGEWLDSDGDGVGDNSDNCPAVANAEQADSNNDSVGDACSADVPVMNQLAMVILASLLLGVVARRAYSIQLIKP